MLSLYIITIYSIPIILGNTNIIIINANQQLAF